MGLLTIQGIGGAPGASAIRTSTRQAPGLATLQATSVADDLSSSFPLQTSTVRAPGRCGRRTDRVAGRSGLRVSPIAATRPPCVAPNSSQAGDASAVIAVN